MSFILINNSEVSSQPKMTPKIREHLKKKGFGVIELKEHSQWNIIDQSISKQDILGIILSGSNIRLTKKTYLNQYKNNITAVIHYPDIPILGICFGAQIMALMYGGEINTLNQLTQGIHHIKIIKKGILFKGQKKHNRYKVYENHRDYIHQVPISFEVTAINQNGGVEAIENLNQLRFGVQFHPEYLPQDKYSVLNNFINFCCKYSSSKKHL